MQLTNAQVLNVLQGLNKLSQNKLPVKLAWKISTAIRSLEPFAKALDEPTTKIRLRYATKDATGNILEAIDKDGIAIPNTIQIPNEMISNFNKEIEELLMQTVEVTNVHIKFSDLPESLELEPAVLSLISPIIDEGINE